ncbi:MAG: hypothetical protein KAT28_01040 [Candidatus Aenigmarchaeota archaeon]|nr:hypothetical protein [Candidatus Aenigmarchaeota archaeon]
MLKRSFDLGTFGGEPGVIVEPYREIEDERQLDENYNFIGEKIINLQRVLDSVKNKLKSEREALKETPYDGFDPSDLRYNNLNKQLIEQDLRHQFDNYRIFLSESQLRNSMEVIKSILLNNKPDRLSETKYTDDNTINYINDLASLESTIYTDADFVLYVPDSETTAYLFNLINSPAQYQK